MFERLVKEHWNQRKYSKDIYAPPEMTQMVKSDRGEMEEMIVAIYASAGTLRRDQLSGNTHQTHTHTRLCKNTHAQRQTSLHTAQYLLFCLSLFLSFT